MDNGAWIASYPRSGSTWMRYIISILAYNNDSITNIDRYVADRQDGIMPKNFSYAKTNRCVKMAGQKVVYIIRHPVDVCASAYRYELLKGNKRDKDKFVHRFVTKGYADFGLWDEHISFWMTSRNKVLPIKYEDMCRGSRPSINQISRHFNVKKHIEEAVEKTDIESMRREEENAILSKKKSNFYNKERERQYKSGIRFIGVGRYGHAGRTISKEHIQKICDKFKRTLERYGYAAVYRLRS